MPTNRPAQVPQGCWPYHHRHLRTQHRCSAGVGLPGMARAPAAEGAHWSQPAHPPADLHLDLGMEEAVLCLGTEEVRVQRERGA